MSTDPVVKNCILKYAKEQYFERRDNTLDTLPHFVEPHKFYIDQYNEYKFKLERFKNLTDDEAKEEEINHRKNQRDDHEKYIAEEKQKVKNLNHLFEKIQKWDCPDSLMELKNFVLQDINWDIIQHTKCVNYSPCIDIEVDGKEFKEEMIERYQGIVDDYSYDVKREQKWADEMNEMLNDLKDSLGDW